MRSKWLNALALDAVALAAALVVFGNLNTSTSNQILNVSYDATRDLYKELNDKFVRKYQKETGRTLTIKQLHVASTQQAHAIIPGLKADVVTLAFASDVDALSQRGLVSKGWQTRLPHRSQPYSSTIVFVVRKGNPRNIADWPDLIQPGVSVATTASANPGSADLGLLAAWGSVTYRGSDAAQARQFVGELKQHGLPRNTGVGQQLSDVQLAWENEALAQVDNSKGELQIVYPPVSIEAEPSVAWVDSEVGGTRKEGYSKAYLQFLYSDQAQEIIARHDLRPVNAAILKKHSDRLRNLDLFPVALVVNNWDEIQKLNP